MSRETLGRWRDAHGHLHIMELSSNRSPTNKLLFTVDAVFCGDYNTHIKIHAETAQFYRRLLIMQRNAANTAKKYQAD